MKRIVSILIILILLLTASAYTETKSASYIECDCKLGRCSCFVQLGDKGGFVKNIINLLKEQAYLPQNTKIGEFTEEVENAVIQFQRNNNLPETGAMDDDTLTLLIWNIDPLELDRTNPIVHEKPETFPDMAYIPTDGGKKHHSNPLCSDMYDPRKVSIRNAIKMGFEACGKCMKREKWLH